MNTAPVQSRNSGNVLLVVLMLMGILTLALGVYLNLTSTENKNVMRSACWNAALPLAEAGVEEAVSHMARNTNDYSLDSWTRVGTNNLYLKQRTNGLDYYSVGIAGMPNSTVTISSTGSVHFLDTNYITRIVQVTARSMNFPSPLGLVAKSYNLSGTVNVDSYDSSNPLYSNSNNVSSGWYDPTRATDKAFVGNPAGSISFGGSCLIYGYAAVPLGASVTVGGSASIGDFSYAAKGIQQNPNHATNGFTFNMPDVSVPFVTAGAPSVNLIAGTNYDYYLGGGDYMCSSLTGNLFGKKMYVGASSRLYVTGNIDLNTIVFADGARLDLYLATPSITFSPTLVNAPPTKFIVWGLPTCTSISLGGSATFIGVIYAPEASLSASGNSQFYGAITCFAFSHITGTFNFHQDLAAGKTDPPQPVTMLSWDEVYARN